MAPNPLCCAYGARHIPFYMTENLWVALRLKVINLRDNFITPFTILFYQAFILIFFKDDAQ